MNCSQLLSEGLWISLGDSCKETWFLLFSCVDVDFIFEFLRMFYWFIKELLSHKIGGLSIIYILFFKLLAYLIIFFYHLFFIIISLFIIKGFYVFLQVK